MAAGLLIPQGVKYERLPGDPPEYSVIYNGQLIGTVKKWERRYNLRRVYVSRGWRARMADGEMLHHEHDCTADTRYAATRAMIYRAEREA